MTTRSIVTTDFEGCPPYRQSSLMPPEVQIVHVNRILWLLKTVAS